ncbi:hypothetical protein V491_02994 [Pseudogymnoascus sp. VKM F-3775]|nr:hypothetical protein V491_02994 [Pseudogymnoascus sp. VKM F-3775]
MPLQKPGLGNLLVNNAPVGFGTAAHLSSKKKEVRKGLRKVLGHLGRLSAAEVQHTKGIWFSGITLL